MKAWKMLLMLCTSGQGVLAIRVLVNRLLDKERIKDALTGFGKKKQKRYNRLVVQVRGQAERFFSVDEMLRLVSEDNAMEKKLYEARKQAAKNLCRVIGKILKQDTISQKKRAKDPEDPKNLTNEERRGGMKMKAKK